MVIMEIVIASTPARDSISVYKEENFRSDPNPDAVIKTVRCVETQGAA